MKIVVCPVAADLLRRPILACVDAGIPVATFCLDAPDSGRFYHIGQDLRRGGLAGYLMESFLGGKGRAGVFTGFFSLTGHEERREGFLEILSEEFPGIEIAWQEENDDHWKEAYEIAKKRLADRRLDGLYVTAGGPFAQGYSPVKAAYDLLKSGKKPDNTVERVKLEIVVRENVDYLQTH